MAANSPPITKYSEKEDSRGDSVLFSLQITLTKSEASVLTSGLTSDQGSRQLWLRNLVLDSEFIPVHLTNMEIDWDAPCFTGPCPLSPWKNPLYEFCYIFKMSGSSTVKYAGWNFSPCPGISALEYKVFTFGSLTIRLYKCDPMIIQTNSHLRGKA